jgi:benzodiazapine receptor
VRPAPNGTEGDLPINERQLEAEAIPSSTMNHLSLILFLVLVVGAQLAKPAFTPPGWIFGPVWTVLYVLVAVTGWRVWQRDRGGSPMKLWWTQLVLNFLWSPVFF